MKRIVLLCLGYFSVHAAEFTMPKRHSPLPKVSLELPQLPSTTGALNSREKIIFPLFKAYKRALLLGKVNIAEDLLSQLMQHRPTEEKPARDFDQMLKETKQSVYDDASKFRTQTISAYLRAYKQALLLDKENLIEHILSKLMQLRPSEEEQAQNFDEMIEKTKQSFYADVANSPSPTMENYLAKYPETFVLVLQNALESFFDLPDLPDHNHKKLLVHNITLLLNFGSISDGEFESILSDAIFKAIEVGNTELLAMLQEYIDFAMLRTSKGKNCLHKALSIYKTLYNTKFRDIALLTIKSLMTYAPELLTQTTDQGVSMMGRMYDLLEAAGKAGDIDAFTYFYVTLRDAGINLALIWQVAFDLYTTDCEERNKRNEQKNYRCLHLIGEIYEKYAEQEDIKDLLGYSIKWNDKDLVEKIMEICNNRGIAIKDLRFEENNNPMHLSMKAYAYYKQKAYPLAQLFADPEFNFMDLLNIEGMSPRAMAAELIENLKEDDMIAKDFLLRLL